MKERVKLIVTVAVEYDEEKHRAYYLKRIQEMYKGCRIGGGNGAGARAVSSKEFKP